MYDISTLITGVTANGLTSPTFTLASDNQPSLNSRSAIVTSLGGTQTGVRTHSPSDPFSITVVKPVTYAGVPAAPAVGAIGRVQRNKTSAVFRKGVIPLTGQAAQLAEIRVDMMIPAGAEVYDKPNIAAVQAAVAAWIARELTNSYLAVTTGSV